MHTKKLGNTTFHHHGDYSGDVIVITEAGEFSLPFADLKAFVSSYVRDSMQTWLEEAGDDEILGVKPSAE